MGRLDEICIINMGQSPDSVSYNEKGLGIPFFQGNADFGEFYPMVRFWTTAPTKVANQGDILISVRAPIGALNIANAECCIGRGLAALTVDEKKCCKKYLWHCLKCKVDELNSKGTGSTFKAINKRILAETEIFFPPLSEQRKIAAVLDKVSDLISKRRKQLDKLDKLVKARFVEMFGDIVANNKGWDMEELGKAFPISSGGTPSTQTPEFWEGGTINWIGSNMCQDVVLTETDGKFITEKGFQNSSAKLYDTGTVLVALVGATIGKTALLKIKTTTNQNIAGIEVCKNEDYSPEFVYCTLQNLYCKFMEIGGGKFKMANLTFVRNLKIPKPNKYNQEQFADFFCKVDKVKSTARQSLEKLELLKKSLMQEYFG